MRRLNRYVEEQAPWKLAKEAAAAATGLGDGCAAAALARAGASGAAGRPRPLLDATLWDLAEGLRLLSVLLYPFIPQTALAIRERLGLGAAAPRRAAPPGTKPAGACCPPGCTVDDRRAALPAHRGVTAAGRAALGEPSRCYARDHVMLIDSHTHLDHCREDAAELVADARAAGVGLIIQSGTDLERSRRSVELAERFPEVFATVGYHPHEAGQLDDAGWAEIEGWTAHPRVVAVGETGFDYYHDNWPHDVQGEVFVRHLDLARRAGLPVVVHTREAAEDTLAALAEHAAGADRDPALLLAAGAAGRGGGAAATTSASPATSPTRTRSTCRRRRRPCRPICCCWRPTRPG